MSQHQWHDLPPQVRTEIARKTGDVRSVQVTSAGSVAAFTATIDAGHGTYFCKGAPTTAGPALRAARIEARLNPHLPEALVPRLRWTIEAAGWVVLGFDVCPGRHADLRPGSSDLPAVAATLTKLAAALTPCPLQVQPATARWGAWINPDLVDGDTLAHTDVTSKNFLVVDRVVHVVDWAMPVRGAAWIDTARMIVRLIRAGHSPGQAEQWARGVPAYSAAPAPTITAFAHAAAKLNAHRRRQRAAEHVNQLASAAAAWSAFRSAGETETYTLRY
ncbi:hypothetical protein [Actinoplanes sp. NBRC 103695]|uniref:hypothetical protein n=1 Tax=Actinoplanes sp. NBRC 103695 TaxID=3032202 RepID=UPI002554A9A5|nr:hypothetical protein [Actinoplanes sp. NBRC 103695]